MNSANLALLSKAALLSSVFVKVDGFVSLTVCAVHDAPDAAMKLLCWNINALIPTLRNIDLKHGSLLKFFEFHQADIVCFQETKILPEKVDKSIACVEGFESFWAVGTAKKGYCGVVTYVRSPWSPVSAEIDSLAGVDREGRVVITDHGTFVLLNIYAPNAGGTKEGRPRAEFKLRFLHALKDKVDSLCAAGKQVLVVGDLNIAASQSDVHSGCNWDEMYSPAEKAVLHALLSELTDTWRLLHPNTENAFTVWDEKTNARPFNRGVRLDYALLSKALLNSLESCEIVATPPKWSDHAALLLALKDVPGPEPHPPCALSSARRFGAQPSVAALFSRKRPTASQTTSQPDAELPAKRPNNVQEDAAWVGSPVQAEASCLQSRHQPAGEAHAAHDHGTPASPANLIAPALEQTVCHTQAASEQNLPSASGQASQLTSSMPLKGHQHAAVEEKDSCQQEDMSHPEKRKQLPSQQKGIQAFFNATR